MIGSKLQEILDIKHINPAELSRLTGISYQTIVSIIKRDNMKVDLTCLLKICDVLNVDIEYFYAEYDEYKKKHSDNLSESNPLLDTLLSNAKQLNTEGLEKLVGYSDDLVSSGKYEKVKIQEKAM